MPRRLLYLLLSFCGLLAGQAQAAETVTVHVASGRSFKGFVDVRTDESQLWLRSENSATALWRPIDWDRVTAAEYQGRTLSPDEFQQLAPQIQSKRSPLEEPDSDSADDPEIEPPSIPVPAGPVRVRSIQITATAANWDADVELDGILLGVLALDENGQPVAVDGSVQAELYGERPAAVHGTFRYTRGEPFPLLGRWTKRITTSDSIFGQPVKLPYQAWQPEFNTGLDRFGVVHARLVAPGQGTFEASVDLVRLRAYSPLRSNLEQLEGTRFLPTERTSRPKRTY